jgi:hypothetical protein
MRPDRLGYRIYYTIIDPAGEYSEQENSIEFLQDRIEKEV